MISIAIAEQKTETNAGFARLSDQIDSYVEIAQSDLQRTVSASLKNLDFNLASEDSLVHNSA